MRGSPTISFRCSEDLVDRLEKRAREMGVTKTYIMEQLLMQYFGVTVAQPPPIKIASAPAGKKDSDAGSLFG